MVVSYFSKLPFREKNGELFTKKKSSWNKTRLVGCQSSIPKAASELVLSGSYGATWPNSDFVTEASIFLVKTLGYFCKGIILAP